MKEKLVALLLVSVMVASAFGAMGISATKVDAATGTKLTIQSSNGSPYGGQEYTLYGWLYDPSSSTNHFLAYRPIDIWYKSPVETTWHFSNTVYTDANGKYSTTTSSSVTVDIQTGFPGDSGYQVSWSGPVRITVNSWPVLTLSSTNYAPAPGQPYTLSGRLTDPAGNPLEHRPVDIYYHFLNGGWQFSNTVYTGADGTYSTTTSSSQTVMLQTGYKVNGVYVASSFVVGIWVQKATTKLTLSTSNSAPAPDQPYTLSGRLTDSAGNGLAYQQIDISYRYGSNSWQYSNSVGTGADGFYSTVTSSSKIVDLQTAYSGGSSYWFSFSNSVTINVV